MLITNPRKHIQLINLYINNKKLPKINKNIEFYTSHAHHHNSEQYLSQPHIKKKKLLEKAEEAEEDRKSGKPRGSLHGLPIAIKDIIGTYDMPTECGTVFRKKMSSSQDSEIVNLLKTAGAIIMGKTVTCELAYIHPSKTKNPHDYTRTPGGSSSGSAAVVASHMAHLSIGSQTGGSIIRPASYC